MKSRLPLPVAERVASRLVAGLREYPGLFSRVEVAGSICCGKSEVGDVETTGRERHSHSPGIKTLRGKLAPSGSRRDGRGRLRAWSKSSKAER